MWLKKTSTKLKYLEILCELNSYHVLEPYICHMSKVRFCFLCFSSGLELPFLLCDMNFLHVIFVICFPGIGHIPNHLAARMIFFFLLLQSLFLMTSYSAIIVSLLQTTSSSINTLEDLINSPLKLSIVNELSDVSSITNFLLNNFTS